MKIVRIPPSGVHETPSTEQHSGNTGVPFIGYYKPNIPGLKSVSPSSKTPFKGRILPCYDLTMDTVDAAFKTGVSSYRVEEWADPNTGVPEFSEFMVNLPCYTFFGKSSNKFLSPTARKRWSQDNAAEDIADPVADVISVIDGSTNAAWRALTQKQGEDYAIIPAATQRTFVNMWGLKIGERSAYNAIVDVTGGAMYDLRDQLNFGATPEAPGRDPRWPQFLLGDVTDPETGLIVTATLITSVPQRKKFNGFLFQTQEKFRHKLEGTEARSVSTEILAGRSLLLSDESVFKILTYQELVDFMLADGAVPQEVIKIACSHMANVTGRDNSRPVHVVPPTQRIPAITAPAAVNFEAEEPFKTPAPVTPTPPKVSSPPPPAPPEDDEDATYYYITGTDKTPASNTLVGIQDVIMQGAQVQVFYGDKWIKGDMLKTIGLKLPEPEAEVAPAPVKVNVSAKYMPPPPPPPDDADDVVANNSSSLFSDEDMAWYRSVEKNAEMHSMNVQEIQKLSDMMRVLGAQTK